MPAKLTLSVDPTVVAAAKRYAANAGTSVSRLVEDYLAALATTPSSNREPPVLARLRGTLRSGSIDDHRAHLVEKYWK